MNLLFTFFEQYNSNSMYVEFGTFVFLAIKLDYYGHDF